MTDSVPYRASRRFRWKEVGNWRASFEADRDLMAESHWLALKAEGDDLKKQLRDDIKKAGFKSRVHKGGGLANTWRGQIYPKSKSAHARQPAYVAGNVAEKITQTFEEGMTIRASGGGLLIPIGPAQRIKLRIGQARTAQNLIAAALAMYGAQRLVSQRLKRTREIALGVFTAAQGGKTRFLPLFILRKSVEAPKKLNAKAIIARWEQGLSDRVNARAEQLFLRQRPQRQAQAAKASPGLFM